MDYNYVRMRNAEKNGDKELAAHYRSLYENPQKKTVCKLPILNYIIALLAVIAVALGVYIAHTHYKVQNASADLAAGTAVSEV